MNIFLTGDVQVGKSTLIDRVLEKTGLKAGGFKTGFGPQRFEVREQYLYMRRADQPLIMDREHAIAYMTETERNPFPEVFDRLGGGLVKEAASGGAEIVIADECAFLERDALEFQQSVLDALDGDIPVFGVVRKGLPGWTKRIVAHPDVILVEVTMENRDELVDELAEYIMNDLNKSNWTKNSKKEFAN